MRDINSLEDVIYEERNGTAYITFNRPEKMNAFRIQSYEEIIVAIDHAAWNREIGAIVLQGHPDSRAFATGGDVEDKIKGRFGRGILGVPVDEIHYHIRQAPKPVIAKVRGYAIGGGNVMCTICDMTIASENAIFGQVGPKMGSVDPGYGTGLLSRVVGEKKAREMWFLCKRYPAKEAYEMGLCNAVVPDDELDAYVDDICREINEKSPTALAIAKRSFNADSDYMKGMQNLGFEATMLYFNTAESAEGKAALKEKRTPEFRAHIDHGPEGNTSPPPEFQDLLYEERDGVAYITLNRPERMNALRAGMYESLVDALQYAGWKKEIGCIVITGAGDRAFCTGGDQQDKVAGTRTGRGPIGVPVDEIHAMIRDVPKPVIAKVRGYAIGGGNVLATVCDMTIASENAKFGQVGPKVGSVDPGFGTAYLARIVGEKRAREIWFMCRRYSAKEAVAMGLANIAVPDDQLDAVCHEWATTAAGMSPTAIAIAKRSFNAASDNIKGISLLGFEAVNLYYNTPEAKEGGQAFREKRDPDFKSKMA